MNNPKTSKGPVRQRYRQRRRSLDEQQRSTFDRAIRQHLLHLINARKPLSIAAYLPFDGEPDLTPVCQKLLESGKQLALPVISDLAGNTMTFNSWHQGSRLQRNHYGIPEPEDGTTIPPEKLDMLLIPLVAYDQGGNRLGMGAGYYDRHLQPLRDLPIPLRVGIAYSIQEVESVNPDDWDVPLHGIVTENGWLAFAT